MKNKRNILADICEEVKNSVFKRWIIDHRFSLLITIVISIFLTILSYPGILYSDSYTRIEFADSLKMVIHAFVSGNSQLTVMDSWLTVLPSFFILLSKEIVGSIVLYTFIQCLSFWFFTYAFLNQLNENSHPLWNMICIVLSPVMLAFGIYYEAGVGCAVAIMLILLLIWKWNKVQTRFDKIVFVLLLTFASFVCFGYRANAFSIIPALAVIIWLREKRFFSRVFLAGSILLGFVCSFIGPAILSINPMSSYAAGFAWEIVSTVQTMDSEKQKEYICCLDDLFGEGATAAALKVSTYNEQESTIVSMFNTPISSRPLSAPGVSTEIIKRYFNLAINEPIPFLKMKCEFISHSLGIGKPINMAEYDYNRWNQMDDYSFNDSCQRIIFVNYFLAFMEFMEVFRRPWILYSICLVLILIWRFRFKGRKSEINLYEAAYLVSIFYYGAFLLNTQSFEFRYFSHHGYC